jgi:hypothetical protein
MYLPESNTQEYSDLLEGIIEQLKVIKDSLKVGESRKTKRKEVAYLQNAISTLRSMKNKNDRKVILISNESRLNESDDFGYDALRQFLRGETYDD